MTQLVEIQAKDGIWTVRLNRPDVRNLFRRTDAQHDRDGRAAARRGRRARVVLTASAITFPPAWT